MGKEGLGPHFGAGRMSKLKNYLFGVVNSEDINLEARQNVVPNLRKTLTEVT